MIKEPQEYPQESVREKMNPGLTELGGVLEVMTECVLESCKRSTDCLNLVFRCEGIKAYYKLMNKISKQHTIDVTPYLKTFNGVGG